MDAATRSALLLLAACAAPPPSAEPAPLDWTSLFDGEQLGGWTPTPFGSHADVRVADGAIVLPYGEPLTGVTWTADFPTTGYELELTATKVSGTDFFCGLTFPVGESHATFVVGGWGGALCGLSCIDGLDASENETRSLRGFERERPYRVRVRVTDERIGCWIDDEQVVDLARSGRELSLRPEVLPSRPLGIATYVTTATVADVRVRNLVP